MGTAGWWTPLHCPILKLVQQVQGSAVIASNWLIPLPLHPSLDTRSHHWDYPDPGTPEILPLSLSFLPTPQYACRYLPSLLAVAKFKAQRIGWFNPSGTKVFSTGTWNRDPRHREMAKEPELLENKRQAFGLSMCSESQKCLCQLRLHYWKHSMPHKE